MKRRIPMAAFWTALGYLAWGWPYLSSTGAAGGVGSSYLPTTRSPERRSDPPCPVPTTPDSMAAARS